MANYEEMSVYELEQKYDSLSNELMKCEDDARIGCISDELDEIQDELDWRYSIGEDD